MPKEKSPASALPKSNTNDEGKNALDELYKDGRFPTLQELADVTKKYEMKLVSITFPSRKEEEKSPQISDDELEFYINNRLTLSEVEKNLAITYGEITGALDAGQALSASAHYSTIKSVLEDNWLLNILERLRSVLLDRSTSPCLKELRLLVIETMQFIKAFYPNRDSYSHQSNADKLRDGLNKIVNLISDFRSLAEARLISSIEKK